MVHDDNAPESQQQSDRVATQQLSGQQKIDRQENKLLKIHKQYETLSIILFIIFMVLIIVVIFFIMQSWFSTNKNVEPLLVSVATSLAASLLFTGVYTLVVDRARRRSDEQARTLEMDIMRQVTFQIVTDATNALSLEISSKIEQRINKMLEEEATRLVSSWPELLPKDYFPPLDQSNPYFMKKLGEAVARSNHYIFRGATARFVPLLLLKHARDDLNCNILIIDPSYEPAVQTYALNRHVDHNNNKTLEEFQEDVREEIYTAIVKLFDLRRRFRIEVRMCHDNLFYRSELVDDGAFVSFYIGERKTIYPPTYFYTKDSGEFYYKAFRKDFQQSWDLAKKQFPMRVNMTQDALEAFLLDIGAGDKATLPAKIAEWRTRQPPV